MIAILSWAWWAQKLSGPVVQAVATAIVAGTIITSIVGGLAWLRSDARSDERAQCTLESATAQAAAEKQANERLAAAERVAREKLQERQRMLDEAQVERDALQATLDALPPPERNRVCYPKDLVRSLNK